MTSKIGWVEYGNKAADNDWNERWADTLMIESRNKNKPFRSIRHSKRFIELREWINDRVTLDAYDNPRNTITLVDDTTLAISSSFHKARFFYLAPWILGVWLFLFYICSTSFWPSDGEIEYANYRLELKKERIERGIKIDKNDFIYHESMLGNDGKSSLLEYINAIRNYGTEGSKKWLYIDMILALILLVLSVGSTILFLRFPRVADIYFDRRRQVVYTWSFGKVLACHFENLGYREVSLGLYFVFYAKHKKKQYWFKDCMVQPTGRIHFNSEDDNTELMAIIFNFMDKGKSAVITGDRFECEPDKYYRYYLRVDEKPENFEQQLAELLKRDHELPELYTKHLF
ncbi:hypothetical protein BS333_15430 [Vibrio azureus]|uniref:Uncharacterized protein n=1 Tax=Vibrio azureus NBRC 104587 TaxID=1219077 RepID=U3AN68_9VIBR|nr:hypothetical protein [Vibrio azureus]AUI87789.1 hypothetical protein BS333_15430 [Vibrio azureus]GAD74742.1 hypothetical protein VAZ01S_014_00300 [Vibrio azureus NBRC 104587]